LKAIVFLVIAGVVGLMAYLGLRGECPSTTAVLSETACLRDGQFPAAVCQTIFERAEAVTRAAPTIYPSEQDCLRDFERCIRSGHTQGFTPVPAGFCVATSGGEITWQEPLYRRINAQPVGSSR
jgi:uncharacterized protein YgiB involved in biofilm formation